MASVVLPAYAGMIRLRLSGYLSSSSAPRVCGDDPGPVGVEPAAAVVLPAYAGMILHARAGHRFISCAPRVCGDDPEGDYATTGTTSCSPRMRG